MIRKFAKYITQSVAGMIGISIYILADTFFISVCAIIFASLFGLNGVWLSFLGSEVITFAVILVLGRKQ